MKADIKPGKYVVAVSGGVDSMVLLDLLSKQKALELVVAHFDHGMREASAGDAEFVKAAAARLSWPFELGHGQLGGGASENTARTARYGFLEEVKAKHEAKAIITAHHQDDLIETAIINLSRGTGPRGLFALADSQKVLRPLLKYPKADIVAYAKAHELPWREDETNQDVRFLRNRVRKDIASRMSPEQRAKFIKHVEQLHEKHNQALELIKDISKQILLDERTLSREAFTALPAAVASQLLHAWLSELGVAELDKPTIDRLSVAIRTAKPKTRQDINQGARLDFSLTAAHFTNSLRSA